MAGLGLIELLVLLAPVVGVALVVAAALRTAPHPALSVPVREARLVGLTRVLGVVAGLAAVWAVTDAGAAGTGPVLAPTAFGTCVLVAVVVGETLVRPRQHPGVRSASLAVRRVRDYLPRTWIPVAAVSVLTAALLVLTSLTGSTGLDAGSGRDVFVTCRRGDYASASGPYPGVHYAVPLALGLLVVLVVAGLAARQVVRRPRGHGDVGGDDALRRRSLRVVVAATGVTLGLSYVGVASTAASALARLGDGVPGSRCAPGWADPLALALGVSVPAVMGLAIVCGFIVLSPGRR